MDSTTPTASRSRSAAAEGLPAKYVLNDLDQVESVIPRRVLGALVNRRFDRRGLRPVVPSVFPDQVLLCAANRLGVLQRDPGHGFDLVSTEGRHIRRAVQFKQS